MPNWLMYMLAGLWCFLWVLVTRRIYRKPGRDETPSQDLKRRMLLFAGPFVLALGIGLAVAGLVFLVT